ncbi:TPR-like protein [Rhizoctonia solani]|uniref:TPR-like protein n=1 Tax=Rhizoctonia solani TaxID=456999 RepID=A0A8H7LME2_9AGAM|nr:TPR-like protein [Rhizoctonia solani]
MKYRTRALILTPKGHPRRAIRHSALGVSYKDQYDRSGELDDLIKSIECNFRARGVAPDVDLDFPVRHTSLEVSYPGPYEELNDWQKSIAFDSRALALTPVGDPRLPDRYSALEVSYQNRFLYLGELSDLDQSIKCGTHALSLTPEGDPDLCDRHNSLGGSYRSRYRRLGKLDDLDKLIYHNSCALTLAPNDDPNLSNRHVILASSHTDRFQRLGKIEDLEKAMEYSYRAMALIPDHGVNISDEYAGLGASYRERYRRLGALDDLDDAIKYESHALKITSDDEFDLPDRYAALGMSYRDRHERLGELNDLEKAIEYESRALALDNEDFPDRHAALGASYGERYRQLGTLEDIERAIKHESRALALTPKDHPDLPKRNSALGVSYSNRYERLGKFDDLKTSLECNSRALALTPDGHPDLTSRHLHWAISCHGQYQHTGDLSYLNVALASFRKASQLSTGAPREVFNNALRWAKLASDHSHLNCIEAFQAVIELLPHFVWLGATATQRYQDLLLADRVAVRAASAAAQSSEYDLALEWLEHARCVVWNQTLMLRSPLDDLESSHPVLAKRIRSVAQQLHRVNFGSIPSLSVPNTPEYRHRLAGEYGDLLAEVHSLPGFKDFLQPIKGNDLMRAARHGPIAAVNCYAGHCDALLVLPDHDRVHHLALSNFSEQKMRHACSKMQKLLQHQGFRDRGLRRPLEEADFDIGPVLTGLWYDIVKPVLDYLGYINNNSTDSLPHVTWCPTGPVSFLPLHAAGDYEQPRSRVFDYVISSYTPSLSALLVLPPALSTRNHAFRVLVVGQASTPGCSSLPGTIRELAHVKSHVEYKAKYSQLIGSQATTATVLDAMDQHDWVHLACHAHQSVIDPTNSGFFLHDGTLDLASITQRSFKNKGLAFLSACQTATGDEELPDEAIHLASGMLMAGYASVIGTMWSVMDEDAPFVADKVYAQLMKGGKIGNGEAGKALHHAVAALRERVGENEFGRWVPYIHMGS